MVNLRECRGSHPQFLGEEMRSEQPWKKAGFRQREVGGKSIPSRWNRLRGGTGRPCRSARFVWGMSGIKGNNAGNVGTSGWEQIRAEGGLWWAWLATELGVNCSTGIHSWEISGSLKDLIFYIGDITYLWFGFPWTQLCCWKVWGVCVCLSLCLSFPPWLSHRAKKGHPPSFSFLVYRNVGSLALSCLLSPFPFFPIAGEDPRGLIWKHLCWLRSQTGRSRLTHDSWTPGTTGTRCHRHWRLEGRNRLWYTNT